MTIAETDKIDIMFRDDEGHAVLVITDHLDWKEFNEGDHLVLLQEKINTYLEFVASGQLAEARPDWKNLPVIIQVDAKYGASKKALEFYRAAGKVIAEAGASLVLHVPASGTTTRF
jgi:hypothetical protein